MAIAALVKKEKTMLKTPLFTWCFAPEKPLTIGIFAFWQKCLYA